MKKLLLSIFAMLLCAFVYAQELPELVPISPNSASLAKYGYYPVNLNSGVPQISVPIYTVKQGGLKVPIGISYHASGIKVNEKASMVGLGWSLNAGGVIVRQVKGIPDEHASSSIINADDVIQNLETYKKFTDIYYKRKDVSPDIYIYNFKGITGRFYIENGVIVNESSSSMKIERKNKKLFVITMPDGTKYRFGTSLDKTSAYEFSDKRSGIINSIMEDMVTSWYLTEIISANKKDIIYFKYKDNNYFKKREVIGSTIKLGSLRYGFIGYSCNWRFATPQSAKIGKYSRVPYESDSYSETYFISGKMIDRIVFKNGEIKFNTTKSALLTDLMKLDSFEIMDNNKVNYLKGSFQYDDVDQYRMKLNSLLISGRGSEKEKKYEFIYNKLRLPWRNSAKQDYWGYANSNNGGYVEEQEVEFLGEHYKIGNGDKSSDEVSMKANVLEKIIYPTGGYTEFDFEANKVADDAVKLIKTPVRTTLQVYGKGTGSWCKTNNEADFKSKVISIPESGFIKFVGGFTPTKQHYGCLIRFTGPNTQEQIVRPSPGNQDYFSGVTVNKEIWVAKGDYTLYVKDTGVGSFGAQECPSGYISVTYYTTTVDLTPTIKDVGGLRIKKIKNYDGVSITPSTIKSYEYSKGLLKRPFNKECFSKYSIDYSPTPISNVNIRTTLQLLLTVSSNSMYEIESNGVNFIEYDKVTEYLEDSKSNKNGKTISYFEATPSLRYNIYKFFFQPSLTTTFAEPYGNWFNYLKRNKPPYYLTKPWNGGQLNKKEIYSLNNEGQYILTSSTENKYKSVNEKLFKPLISHNLISPKEQNCNSPTYYYSFLFGAGFVSTGKKLLKSTKEIQYDFNGVNPIETIKNYTYNNDYLLSETSTKTSKREILKEKIYYPNDVVQVNSLGYSNLTIEEKSAIDSLKNQYRIATPMQVETYENNVLKSVQRTKYKNFNGLYLPKDVQTLKGKYNATTNPLETRIVYHSYDDKGNPTEISKKNGTNIVYIWGYNKTQPIAKIENATLINIASNTITSLQNLSNLDKDVVSENTLRTALNTLRGVSTLSKSQITTFTYNPLIGVTSITDPRGKTIYYEYDSFNRLQYVKDAQKNILKENKYNYKN